MAGTTQFNEETTQGIPDPVIGDPGKVKMDHNFPECTFKQFHGFLKTTKSYEEFLKKLLNVARDLGVPVGDVVTIERGLKNETKRSEDAVDEILRSWRSKFGQAAKLSVFLFVLRGQELQDLAEEIYLAWVSFVTKSRTPIVIKQEKADSQGK